MEWLKRGGRRAPRQAAAEAEVGAEEAEAMATPRTRRADASKQIGAVLVVNIMMISYGLVAGWPATVLPQLMAPDSPLPDGPLSLDDATWLATLLTITGIPIAPPMAVVCERWGRKSVGYLTAILHLVGNLITAISLNVKALYISRSLLGVACACGFLFTPLYIREISDDTTRGPLGVLMTVIINVGVLAAYVIGAYCSATVTSLIFSVPPVVFLIMFFWMPETPVFLLRKGRERDAKESLSRFRAKNHDVQGELEVTKQSLVDMKADAGDFKSIFKELITSKASRRAGLIMLVLMVNQQFSGLFCIISYTVQIFQEAGSQMSPYVSSIIVGFMLLLGTIISAFLCTRLGRKTLLIISDVFMTVSLFGMGFYFYLKHIGDDTSKYGWAPVVCLSLFVVAFNIGVGPITIVLYTEIFSPKLVSTALAVSGPIPGILAFIIGKFFYTVADIIGVHSCYWGFAIVCVLGMAFIIATLPETRNRPLDSILRELEGYTPVPEPSRKHDYDPVEMHSVDPE